MDIVDAFTQAGQIEDDEELNNWVEQIATDFVGGEEGVMWTHEQVTEVLTRFGATAFNAGRSFQLDQTTIPVDLRLETVGEFIEYLLEKR